ncbi:MAG: pentapeptide repeat-containing protein [Actinophytocola sp.]|uniref:pentapeptide repeat-containing protein n=1 Tax=Actinophytocola sp. TaxID=1872138 RepID=UPI003D6B131B
MADRAQAADLGAEPEPDARGACRHCRGRRGPPDHRPVRQGGQEHQVRRTAQAILFRHLLVGNEEEPADTFWSGVSLDLTGALLGPANLIGCRVTAADFTGATFTGDVWPDRARFGLDAVFGRANFDEAEFRSGAVFTGTVIEETGERPHGVQDGRWGLLVHAPKDEK